jgi:hypothetical protein
MKLDYSSQSPLQTMEVHHRRSVALQFGHFNSMLHVFGFMLFHTTSRHCHHCRHRHRHRHASPSSNCDHLSFIVSCSSTPVLLLLLLSSLSWLHSCCCPSCLLVVIAIMQHEKNSMLFHAVPCNMKKYSMLFHAVPCSMKKIPCSFMQFHAVSCCPHETTDISYREKVLAGMTGTNT